MAVTNVQIGRSRQAAILECLGRFPALSRQHLTQLVFGGNVRAANASLLALHRQGLVQRYEWHGQFVYSLSESERSHLTEHQMTVADIFCAMQRTAGGYAVDGYSEVQLTDDLRADLLVLSDSYAVLTEVHLASNGFSDKYALYASVNYRQQPWLAEGMGLRLWIVAPTRAVPWLEKSAQPFRERGLTITVSSLNNAVMSGWRALGIAPQRRQDTARATPKPLQHSAKATPTAQ